MANSDDPPYLSVGTEVSAKYRGAFCEATIKIAKKLVKCKVSYGKGHSAVVSDDCINGTLKVGAQVDVTQPDGQVLTGNIVKLTDQTTYTVVFDDGDERTLKRSSLCLKGGRHFDKSEIVPTHYVLEESDRQPNTICLRSFKDGRFFAVTKNELHEFSPNKEPLLSMLEGDIQPMYMCKPAIERAMAYLDTGELPWNMDLFDGQGEKQGRREDVGGGSSTSGPSGSGASSPGKQNGSPTQEEDDRNRALFMEKLRTYHENRGTPLNRTPILAQKDLDLYRLYHLVQENGGMESVTREMKWRSLYLQLGIPLSTNASHALKQAYRKYLYGFECYEKNKGRLAISKDSPTRGRKRAALATLPEVSEPGVTDGHAEKMRRVGSVEDIKSETVDQRAPQLLVKKMKGECSSWIETGSAPSRETPSSLFPAPLSSSVAAARDSHLSPTAGGGRRPELQSRAESTGSPLATTFITTGAECSGGNSGVNKLELLMSDRESSQGDAASSTAGEEGEEMGETWVKRETQKFAENDRVLVWYGYGKNLQTYEAKIIGLEESEDKRDYLVHYSGWNNRYNEWIEESRIVKRITNPTKHARPPYKKKKVKMTASERRKAAKERGSGQAASAEQLFMHVAAAEERVPPPTATPTPPKAPSLDQPGTMRTSRPSPAKRRHLTGAVDESSDHHNTVHQDSSSPSPPQLHHRHHYHLSPPPSLTADTHPSTTSPPPPVPSNPSSLHSPPTSVASPSSTRHVFPAVTQTLVPPPQIEQSAAASPHELGMSCAIEVKKEVNYRVLSPPQGQKQQQTADEDNHDDSLLCQERLLGSRLKPEVSVADSDAAPKNVKSAENVEQSTTSNSDSVESSTDEESKSPLPPLLSPIRSPPDEVWSSPATQNRTEEEEEQQQPLGLFDPAEKDDVEEEDEEEEEEDGETGEGGEVGEGECEDAEEEEERTEAEKSGDEKSSVVSSEKEPSPSSVAVLPTTKDSGGGEKGAGPSDGECVTRVLGEKRKRVRETEEEYETRRMARRESLNFVIDFSSRPELKCGERVRLIEEHIRLIQEKWSALKSEVAHLDRQRRRARRKEREAARILAQAHQFHQSSSTQSSSSTLPVECH